MAKLTRSVAVRITGAEYANILDIVAEWQKTAHGTVRPSDVLRAGLNEILNQELYVAGKRIGKVAEEKAPYGA